MFVTGRVPYHSICAGIRRTTRKSKGIALAQFESPADAVAAHAALDRSVFLGRLLHILPGQRPPPPPEAAVRLQRLAGFASCSSAVHAQAAFGCECGPILVPMLFRQHNFTGCCGALGRVAAGRGSRRRESRRGAGTRATGRPGTACSCGRTRWRRPSPRTTASPRRAAALEQPAHPSLLLRRCRTGCQMYSSF